MLRSRYNNGGLDIDYFSTYCCDKAELLHIHGINLILANKPYKHRQLSTFIHTYCVFNTETLLHSLTNEQDQDLKNYIFYLFIYIVFSKFIKFLLISNSLKSILKYLLLSHLLWIVS